jgi:hypothetical protein
MLCIIYPEDMRDPESPTYSEETARMFKNYCDLWSQFKVIWELIVDHKTPQRIKATKLRDLNVNFIDMWKTCIMATTHLYPHILEKHLPWFIEYVLLFLFSFCFV